jgi:hypothetical protein
MKPTVYALFFIVALVSVTAGTVEKAEVHVTVINNPPEVVSIQTSDPLEGSPLSCDAVIKDEIEDVKTSYQWYNNNVLIEGQDINVLDATLFKQGDVITCEAIPNDLVQDGEPKSVSVTIKPKPLVSAITGAVVGLGKSQGFLNSFLFLLLIALVIFNIAYFLRRR